MSTPSTIGMIIACAYCSTSTMASTASDRQRRAADVDRHADRRVGGGLPSGLRPRGSPADVADGFETSSCTSSSACSALLIATAAFTPSAAATTTNCASRDASPATNSARDVGVAQRAGLHRAAARQRASERDREIRLRMLAGREEHARRAAADRPTRTTTRLSAPSSCSSLRDRLGADRDAVAREPLAQPPRPAGRRACRRRRRRSRSSGRAPARRRRVPRPNAASRRSRRSQPSQYGTVKDRAAVAVVEAGNGGQIVDDAGGDQQVARRLPPSPSPSDTR